MLHIALKLSFWQVYFQWSFCTSDRKCLECTKGNCNFNALKVLKRSIFLPPERCLVSRLQKISLNFVKTNCIKSEIPEFWVEFPLIMTYLDFWVPIRVNRSLELPLVWWNWSFHRLNFWSSKLVKVKVSYLKYGNLANLERQNLTRHLSFFLFSIL